MSKHPKENRSILSLFLKGTKSKFFYLLISLVLLLLVYPFLEHGTIREAFLSILSAAIPITSIYAVSYNKRNLIIAILLGVPTVAGELIDLSGIEFPHAVIVVFALLFYLFTLITIISYVFRYEEVTGDTIYGAICVYFLIGITWTTIFVLINILQPGSFYINPPNNIDNVQDWSDFIYYSYATLTTLGYGDITPVTSQARSFGVLETIIGQLYLTILVARLIGLHLTKSIKRES
ncbi:MAG: potassium channel family protein [Thermodesulfobacteriota bacterium]